MAEGRLPAAELTTEAIAQPGITDRIRAYRICDLMSVRMREMGVVTSAHYDTGVELMMIAFAAVRADRDQLWKEIAEARAADPNDG